MQNNSCNNIHHAQQKSFFLGDKLTTRLPSSFGFYLLGRERNKDDIILRVYYVYEITILQSTRSIPIEKIVIDPAPPS